MRENRPSGSMRGEARRSLASASQSVRFAYSTYTPRGSSYSPAMLKQRRKVVISLHGINTDGAWQKDVAPIIREQGWVYYPLYYQFIKRAAEAIRDGQVFPILQTLSLLDHRQDDELGPAILESRRMIEKILDGPHSDARALVKTEAMADLTV